MATGIGNGFKIYELFVAIFFLAVLADAVSMATSSLASPTHRSVSAGGTRRALAMILSHHAVSPASFAATPIL